MKCKVCGQPASINLRSYKLALCDTDFVTFFEKRVLTTVRKYDLIIGQDKPIIAVSGGKDSLSLWHIMSALGIDCDGIYIDLGIEGYSDKSLEKIKQTAAVLNRKLYVFRIASVLDCGIDGLAKALKRVPCSACGMVKRYIMNRICVEKGYNVLVTGHNLDDEASALLGNVLYWKKEYLWKKDILLEGKEGHLSKKVKPLFLCSERESAAYAIIKGIDYVYEECPFSTRAKSITYKHMLNTLEATSPGTKLAFIKGYLKTMKDMPAAEQTAHET
ncbi:MAG TPA: tRNA 2-thiocytidine biosynthesis TtcA family protein, partial [Syntrophorhabdaceae bacterium]|nr:tRNA 2-thiocytidine biosynthesis TtcA family protein [Syntrophorhabdaceae bacterium]